MKKLNLATLLLGAFLLLSLSATNANAAMKCGAGKCGSAMMDKGAKSCEKPDCKCGPECKCGDNCKCDEVKATKSCGNKDCSCGPDCKCGDNCQCGKKKATIKCGAGK